MRINIYRALFGIVMSACLIFQFSSQVNSQEVVQVEKSRKENSGIKKVVKVEGWKLPLDKKLSSPGTVYNKIVDGITLTLEARSFNEKFVFYFDTYQIGEDGSLHTRDFPCQPVSITSLKIQDTDKIFGYGLDCSAVILDKDGKIEANTLRIYPLFYYDENGDGKFEARYYSANPPSFPDWVTQKAEKLLRQ